MNKSGHGAALLQPATVPTLHDLARLAKPRLGLWVLASAVAGYLEASAGTIRWEPLGFTLLGIALTSAGAATLNQWIETPQDGLMPRTWNRPLPAGRITRSGALTLGIALSGAGLSCLALGTPWLAVACTLATLLLYLAIYTPLKQRTPWCVIPGAISGAMPPVIGWAAAGGPLSLEAGLLFGVLFAWQMPHLLAIAWMHRDEYSKTRITLISRGDPTGKIAAAQALAFSILLAILTLFPAFTPGCNPWYLPGTAVLNSLLLACAVRFVTRRDHKTARQLFHASIAYLPLQLLLMIAR